MKLELGPTSYRIVGDDGEGGPAYSYGLPAIYEIGEDTFAVFMASPSSPMPGLQPVIYRLHEQRTISARVRFT